MASFWFQGSEEERCVTEKDTDQERNGNAEGAETEPENVEALFYVDNSKLNSCSPGIRYRLSKDMGDKDYHALAKWGSTVVGVDDNNGWVQVGQQYLPTIIRGTPVLVLQATKESDVGDPLYTVPMMTNAERRERRKQAMKDELALEMKAAVKFMETQEFAHYKAPPRHIIDGFYNGSYALVTLSSIGLAGLVTAPVCGLVNYQHAACTSGTTDLAEKKQRETILGGVVGSVATGICCGLKLPSKGAQLFTQQILQGIIKTPMAIADSLLPCLTPYHHRVMVTWRFFHGLQMEETLEGDSTKFAQHADEFVTNLLTWGGIYPKLAQRLRYDKSTVKSNLLRVKLGRVMEHCQARSHEDVTEHLLKHLGLSPEDLEVVETLGTGTVAQVALVCIKGEKKVVKMTWPEDEQKFISDFEVLESLREDFIARRNAGEELDESTKKAETFLSMVLSKKEDVLAEFNLELEAENTKLGQGLIEKCKGQLIDGYENSKDEFPFNIRVPYVISHGRHALEQELAHGTSLEKLLNPRNAVKAMIKAKVSNDYSEKEAIAGACMAYTRGFVPLLARMLFSEQTTHADAHSGNLFYDHSTQTLWVIDWGATVNLTCDEAGGLQDLVRELAVGELTEVDTRAATRAATRLTHCNLGIDVWRYFMHPGKYVAPENLDLEEIKRTCHNGQLVLLAETVLLASRTVNALSVVMEHFLQLTAPQSLLSLWSSVADLSHLATSKHEVETSLWMWWFGTDEQDDSTTHVCVRYLDTENTILQVAAQRNDRPLIDMLRKRRDYTLLAQMKVPHPDSKRPTMDTLAAKRDRVVDNEHRPSSVKLSEMATDQDKIPLTATPADIAKHQGRDEWLVELLSVATEQNSEAEELSLKIDDRKEEDIFRAIEGFQHYFPELDVGS